MKNNFNQVIKLLSFMAMFYFCCAVYLVERSASGNDSFQKALFSPSLAIERDLGHDDTVAVSLPDDKHAQLSEKNPSSSKRNTTSYFERQSDGALSLRVQQGLDSRLTGNIENIKITSKGGTVHLEGSVKNEQDKTMITDQIRHMAGVNSVDNQLVIQ
jgi:hypothetical protein